MTHVVAVDGVCGQTQAGGRVHLGDVHLEHNNVSNVLIEVFQQEQMVNVSGFVPSVCGDGWFIRDSNLPDLHQERLLKPAINHTHPTAQYPPLSGNIETPGGLFSHLRGSLSVTLPHLESLTDSRIKHRPIHATVHSHGANEEVLLFHLLQKRHAQRGSQ